MRRGARIAAGILVVTLSAFPVTAHPEGESELASEMAGVNRSLAAISKTLHALLRNQRVDLQLRRIELLERRLEPQDRELRGARSSLRSIQDEITQKEQWLEEVRPEYLTRDARLARMDEQGLEAEFLFPTLAVCVEQGKTARLGARGIARLRLERAVAVA